METAVVLPTPIPVSALITPPMSPEPVAVTKPVPLILFGRDEGGRVHAACFTEHDSAAVERAGDLVH